MKYYSSSLKLKDILILFRYISLTFVIAFGLITIIATGGGDSSETYESGTTNQPPFLTTVSIDPDIITSSDPTSYQGIVYVGQDSRFMFDRRSSSGVTVNAYLFLATYDDGFTVEVQVNPEFGSVEMALAEAEMYAEVIGQLPAALRMDLETVCIHKGDYQFGGGNNNILIHVDHAEGYLEDNLLEEVLVHEGVHTSLDDYCESDPDWLAARSADSAFISDAAEKHLSEDVAESFLAYFAIRYRSDRISESLQDVILDTIPNRIAYFDSLGLDMYPIQ